MGGPGRIRSYGGPVTSGDGSVVLYPPAALPSDTFIALQLATPPTPPAGVQPIGRAYTLRPNRAIDTYASGSLLFYYLGIDVALSNVPEGNLAVYYWNGTTWQRLATTIDSGQNIASAALVGPGTYQLMTSYGIPLAAGWNLVAYPLQETQSPTVALASIIDDYTIIAGYDPTNPAQPWQMYDPNVTVSANNLDALEPGKGYWIYAERTTVWRISPTRNARTARVETLPFPPARFYGTITGNSDFTPTSGLPVQVFIGDTFCGEGETQEIAGQIIYLVDVWAAESTVGCGTVGQTVSFVIDSHPFLPEPLWWNGQIQVINLFSVGAKCTYKFVKGFTNLVY
ncbi:MAG: hypothetical protein KDE19_01610 [Caldilineaceae bacterium]|nr:hypothetical protein [Caldilineaceae bacterium]